METILENIIIIWWGPAGHTAAIYAARAWLEPLMFEGFMAGGIPPWGQLTLTTEIENFPWFPKGIRGLELMQEMKKQSKKFWTRIETKTVDSVDFSCSPFKVIVGEQTIETKSLIIATGATANRLRIPGENKFWQRGISVCATCDGGLPVFKGQTLVVVGGGDVACEEAVFLSYFGSKVVMLVRKDVLRASQVMQEKVLTNPKIEIMRNTEAVECFWEGVLQGLKVKNNKTGEEKDLECKGLFYAIGHTPNTAFLDGLITLDQDWYIITSTGGKTNIPWVFAAGDVQDKAYRQAITSAWSGCISALEAEKYLKGIV